MNKAMKRTYREIHSPHQDGKKWIIGTKNFMFLMSNFKFRFRFDFMSLHQSENEILHDRSNLLFR